MRYTAFRIGILVALVFVAASGALSMIVSVSPGPGTPLRDAIAAAHSGDTSRIAAGTYAEMVVVDKPLRLIGAGANLVTINAGCTSPNCPSGLPCALAVAANDVAIQNLTVIGGTDIGVDVAYVDHVSITGVATYDVCGQVSYGVNVYQSTRVRVRRNAISNMPAAEAAIYVGSIPANGRVVVERNVLTKDGGGVLVEDSLPGVVVKSNTIIENDIGIWLTHAQGDRVFNNTVTATGNREAGIRVDGYCDDNLVVGNTISGYPIDAEDDGTNDCWKRNTFVTGSVPPCP